MVKIAQFKAFTEYGSKMFQGCPRGSYPHLYPTPGTYGTYPHLHWPAKIHGLSLQLLVNFPPAREI